MKDSRDVNAVYSLKAGKSPLVDNIPSELLKNGGEAATTVLTAIGWKIWEKQILKKKKKSETVDRRRSENKSVLFNLLCVFDTDIRSHYNHTKPKATAIIL